MEIERLFIILLAVASLIAVLAQRSRIPYVIAMLLTGTAVGFFAAPLTRLADVQLTPHLILIIFLPGLLFEAAFHLDPQDLFDNIRPIAILAVPGVLIAASIVTLILVTLTGLPVGLALLFGVLISATDPISVIAIFKQLGVDKRLGVIVEGESLFNDGTALVLFQIVLAIVLGEQQFQLATSISQFFVVVAGGFALGLAAGLLIAQLMRRTDDPLVDMALTTVLAYGTFIIAEELHVSPVIAVVVAGIYVGNFGERGGFSASTRLTLTTFWAYLAFLINSAIFLLIGLDVELGVLIQNAAPVGAAILAMLVARLLVIYPLGFIANRRSSRGLPLSWIHVLFWGGLRGSVSLALALSLPFTLPNRELLELMTFGVVFFSLVVQGLTMRPLLRALGIGQTTGPRRDYERRWGRWAMLHAALHAVDRLHEENMYSLQVRDRLRGTYSQHTTEAWESLEELIAEYPDVLGREAESVQRVLADEQKIALQNMLKRGVISEEVYTELSREIDQQIMSISRGKWQGGPPMPFSRPAEGEAG